VCDTNLPSIGISKYLYYWKASDPLRKLFHVCVCVCVCVTED